MFLKEIAEKEKDPLHQILEPKWLAQGHEGYGGP